jgi:hypothetical protein
MLAAALLALDLDALSAREALQWLWEHQDRLRHDDEGVTGDDLAI